MMRWSDASYIIRRKVNSLSPNAGFKLETEDSVDEPHYTHAE